jgi:hypothetical protein
VEVFRLLEDRNPGKSSLIDLKDESLEEQIIIFEWETILRIVIGFVVGVFRVGVAVIAICGHDDILPLE